MNKIGFIGSGKMAEALIAAVVKGGIADAKDIICSVVAAERLAEVRD